MHEEIWLMIKTKKNKLFKTHFVKQGKTKELKALKY